MPPIPEPLYIVHADWGKNPGKRWMASALIAVDGSVHASATRKVQDAATLLVSRPPQHTTRTPALFGFDFPIGLPHGYAERTSVSTFRSFLSDLANGKWPEFANLAETRDQISLQRPFYPRKPGGTRQQHLFDGHSVPDMDALRRRCEKARPGRRAACSLFWTLGGQQVGRGALSGWLESLLPAVSRPDLDVAIWPFDGELNDLLDRHATTVAETYPAEFYSHLGIKLRGSKRKQDVRREHSDALLDWARTHRIRLSTDLHAEIEDAFGSKADGEDRFDAVVGLMGMLNVLLGKRGSGEPLDDPNLAVEGWILGLDHDD
jgi:hypothetical protein